MMKKLKKKQYNLIKNKSNDSNLEELEEININLKKIEIRKKILMKVLETLDDTLKLEIKKEKGKMLSQTEDNDLVMNYYIKSVKNISIIFIYPKALKQEKNIEKLINELKNNGTIYYEKDIEFNFYMMYNLIYQLYYNEFRMKTPMHIIYKVNRLGFEFYDNSYKKIKILVYKHKNIDEPINGSSAPYKMKIRDIFLPYDIKHTKFNPEDDNYPRGYDYIHVNDNDNQAYDYAGILFNKNSIKFLKKQQSWKIYEMENSIEKFNTVKRILYNFSQKEIEKLLLMSSAVLFSHGVREMNDVDGFLLKSDIIDPDTFNNIDTNIIDISYEGTKKYNDNWDIKLNEKAQLYEANNFIDLIINPKYHYYFMGIKFLRLKYEIIGRHIRKRPAQLTDLLVLKQIYNFNYQLNIPQKTQQYNLDTKKDDYKVVVRDTYLSTMLFYLKKRYYINISLKELEDWLSKSSTIDNQKAGSDILLIDDVDISNDINLYPTKNELVSKGYLPKITILEDWKPFLYPGETFNIKSIKNMCSHNEEIKLENTKNLFSIMSFNVHNFVSRCNAGISPIFNNINPYYKGRTINRFINIFSKYSPNILCLQEVVPILQEEINELIDDYDFITKNYNFKYLVSEMNKIGYKYQVIANTRRIQYTVKEQNLSEYYILCNAIFSKIPIKKYKIKQFSFVDRNFIHIEISWNGKNIDIINTHLEYFDLKKSTLDGVQSVVLEQFIQLEKYLNSLNNKNVIICGDFNINLYKKKMSIRYKDYDLKTKYLKENYNIINTKIPTNFSQEDITDFILLKKNSILKNIFHRVIKINISDHYPVVAFFK